MNLSKKKRDALRLLFGGKCAYCGVDLPEKGWHADHVKPIDRKMKWDRDQRRFVATGECYRPENDTEDNLYPACQPCNTHKGPSSLEGWRRELERITGILHRGYPTYRHAVRFRQIVETTGPIVFWFERYEKEAA